MKKIALIAPLCLVLALACSSGQSPQDSGAEKKQVKQSGVRDRIAVLDFKADGVPQKKAAMIAELVRTEIISTNKYTVIERSQMDQIFKEHGLSNTGITDESGAAKLGKLLSAQKILIGTVMQLGDNLVITSRVVDVEKGIAEFAAKVTADDDSLLEQVGDLVAQLTGAETDDGAEAPTKATAKASVKANKKTYKLYEDIQVTYKNFPGTSSDYISLALITASAKNHYTYQYTGGQKNGTVTFSGGIRHPGEYEVRAHTEYSKGSYDYTAKFKIKVEE